MFYRLFCIFYRIVSSINGWPLCKYLLDSLLDCFNLYHHKNDHIVILYKWKLYDLYLTLQERTVQDKQVSNMAMRLSPCEQLNEANRNLLVSNMAFLQENLELSKLLPYMTPVLNDEDFASIRSLPTTREQVEMLVTILPERGDKAFDCFIKNLRISQPHLADHMFKKVSSFFGLLPEEMRLNHKQQHQPINSSALGTCANQKIS